MDQWDQIQEDIRRENEARERAARDAVVAEREARREGRETHNLRLNLSLAIFAGLAALTAIYQGIESHTASKEAQKNFEITRQDAKESAAQARQDTLDQFKQQLDAQHDLRDQAARSANAASAAALAAKAQTEIMGKQMTLSQQIERPWIGIDGDIVPTSQGPVDPIPGEGGSSLSVAAQVKLQNFGQSVARRVQAQFKLDDSVISLMAREAHWRQAAKPLCDEAEKKSSDENQTAVVIFPGSSAPFEAGFLLSSFSYQHSVLAVGCIVYREQGAETIHHTRTLYRAEFGQRKQDPKYNANFYQEIARFTPLDVDAD